MNRVTQFLIGLLALAPVSVCFASYLTSDYEEAPQPTARPEPIIRPIPPPPPPPPNPLADLVRRVRVQEGYSYRGLTVFPLELTYVADGTSYLSVQEAVGAGVLSVRERGAGTVPSLIVENTGDQPVLMLGGELLVGGKQNRVLREDVLLSAHSGPVEAPVLCIEQGRWSTGADDFRSKDSVAPLAVRGSAQAGASQEAVWEGVRRYQDRLEVGSATRDLQAVHESPEVRKALADYRECVGERCWRRETVGMVVARGGVIVGADVFCNAAMFRKHRDRLLDSYAVDCIAYLDREARWPEPSREAAAEFLRRVLSADCTWRSTPGAGRLLAVSGAGLTGSALAYRDNVLHAGLFPAVAVIIEPAPVLRPLPVE